MDTHVESPGKIVGTRLEIRATDYNSDRTSMLPKRIRDRLCKTPSHTSDQIQAKLRDADLRRQQFYNNLSNKARARPNPRKSLQFSSHEELLGQRLKTKLQVAEQKRLSILVEAQLRLARLDKLRQAAKTGVELRFEKEREKLGTKVESRFVQAETNRMLILKAYGQRRATVKERRSQLLLRRMAWENKYKECVNATMYQKRVAAEKKRLGLLEAEKNRARSRVLQVRQIAKSVLHQREIERRKMKDSMEDRLQRAMNQRAEYLRQRGRAHRTLSVYRNKIHKQDDLLSRKIARCWRRFRKLNRTTFSLVKAYDSLEINEESVKLMPFEQFALLIESNATLQTVKALLDRFESRFKLSLAVADTASVSNWDNIDNLLMKVASPNRSTPRNSTRSRDSKKHGSAQDFENVLTKLSRYQVRIVLCAYMILGHPDAVLNGKGEREISLIESAGSFVRELELLIKILLDRPMLSSDEESEIALPIRWSFRSQLTAFDRAWCSYLSCFVLWKAKDALSLEDNLVRTACQLELSMMQTLKMTPEGKADANTYDLKVIQKQVVEDNKLLREKVQHLSGKAGIDRMECALLDTRTKYFQAKERGSPVGGSINPGFLTSSPTLSSKSRGLISYESIVKDTNRPNRVVRSLFPDNVSTLDKEFYSDSKCSLNSLLDVSGEQLTLENEVIVNGAVHDQNHTLADELSVTADNQNDIKVKIREIMEKAFWDGVIESMKQNEPNYDRVIELVREVRDEICKIAPKSYKQEIIEAIDLDIFSQVLKSGNLAMDYFGKILEFALATLQKLSTPASDEEMKITRQNLLNELAEICQSENESNYMHAIAIVKGLRFVLQRIKVLKQEIDKAHIKIMEPLLKGPAGLDYLKRAFANRYGSSFLPLTAQWLSSVWDCTDLEWSEHRNFLSALTNYSSSETHLPSALKTGLHVPIKLNDSQGTFFESKDVPIKSVIDMTGNQQPECKGEKVDLLLRLGLLKLVSCVPGLTQETLPETLKLNFFRLRHVQSQIQKIIVISTSSLICRQILVSEQLVATTSDMKSILSKCIDCLKKHLDGADDAGIEEIIEIISGMLESKGDSEDKLRSRKEVVGSMLVKSLRDGDPVFVSVSRAVYLALRAVMLGGSIKLGRVLSENALCKVGAIGLIENVVECANVLTVVATVSADVHGEWYAKLVEKM